MHTNRHTATDTDRMINTMTTTSNMVFGTVTAAETEGSSYSAISNLVADGIDAMSLVTAATDVIQAGSELRGQLCSTGSGASTVTNNQPKIDLVDALYNQTASVREWELFLYRVAVIA